MKLALAGTLLAGLLTADLLACSCAPLPPPTESKKQAAAVFTAKVERIETKGFEFVVTLKVAKSWKGVKKAEVQVYTPTDGAACGVAFEEKQEWLIYAYTDPETKNLNTHICTRTTLAEGAEEELKELGKPIWEKKDEE